MWWVMTWKICSACYTEFFFFNLFNKIAEKLIGKFSLLILSSWGNDFHDDMHIGYHKTDLSILEWPSSRPLNCDVLPYKLGQKTVLWCKDFQMQGWHVACNASRFGWLCTSFLWFYKNNNENIFLSFFLSFSCQKKNHTIMFENWIY